MLLDLGKIRFNWAGTWTATANYEKDDVVYYEGSAYISKVANFGKDPRDYASTWDKMASGLNYRGNWTAGAPGSGGETWYKGDLVMWASALHIMTADQLTSATPPTSDTTNWDNITGGQVFSTSSYPAEIGSIITRDSTNNVQPIVMKNQNYRKNEFATLLNDDSVTTDNFFEPHDFYNSITPYSELRMMPHRDDDLGEPTEWVWNLGNGLSNGYDMVNYHNRYQDNTPPICMLDNARDNVDTSTVWWRVLKTKRASSTERNLSLLLGPGNELLCRDESGTNSTSIPIPFTSETMALTTRHGRQYLKFDLSHSSLSGVTIGYSATNNQGGDGGGGMTDLLTNNETHSAWVAGVSSGANAWRVWSHLVGTPGSANSYLRIAVEIHQEGAITEADHNLVRGFLYQTNNTNRQALRVDHGRVKVGADIRLSHNERIGGINRTSDTLNFTSHPYGDPNSVAFSGSTVSSTTRAFDETFTWGSPYNRANIDLHEGKYMYWHTTGTGNPNGRIEFRKPIMAPAFIRPDRVEIFNATYTSDHAMTSLYVNWFHIPDWQDFRYIEFDLPNVLTENDGAELRARLRYGGNMFSPNGSEHAGSLYEYSLAYPYESGISYSASTGTGHWPLNRRAGSAGRETAQIQARLYGLDAAGTISSDGQEGNPTFQTFGFGQDTADRSRGYIGGGFCKVSDGNLITGLRIYASAGHFERITCKAVGYW